MSHAETDANSITSHNLLNQFHTDRANVGSSTGHYVTKTIKPTEDSSEENRRNLCSKWPVRKKKIKVIFLMKTKKMHGSFQLCSIFLYTPQGLNLLPMSLRKRRNSMGLKLQDLKI